MESTAYEELCRVFVAEKVGLAVEDIRSVKIPNPNRPNLPQFSHQIDLYWEFSGELAVYLNIANAKWRGSDKVDQPDVLLLQQVRTDTGSHKAFMLTNGGFTAGAIAAAQHHGIALHVVVPAPGLAESLTGSREVIRERILALSAKSPKLYSHTMHTRGVDFVQGRTPEVTARPMPGLQTRVQSVPMTRAPAGIPAGGTHGGGGSPTGPSPLPGPQGAGGVPGGIVTRVGGGFTRRG